MKKTVSALLVLCMLFLCGCQTQPPVSDTTPTETEPKVSDPHRLSGGSRFIYHNGKIYFISGYDIYTSSLPIHAYDLATGTLTSNESVVRPHSTSGYSDNIWSDGTDLYRYCTIGETRYRFRIAPDFSSEEVVEQTPASSTGKYNEGYLYHVDAVVNYAEQRWEFTLYRRNLETKEETVVYEYINESSSYVIDERYIYFLRYDGSGIFTLLRSPKDTIQFEVMDIPHPIDVIPVDGGVLIRSGEILKLLSYKDNSITDINIKGLVHGLHFVGDHTIVSRHTGRYVTTRSTRCKALSIFDTRTGESTMVCDSVVDFDVLEDRYICYWWADWRHHKWFVYDMQTGQTQLMFEELESDFLVD